MGAVHCSKCGKRVSNEVPEDLVVRAWIECPECIESSGEEGLASGWTQYKCRGCGEVSSALKDSLCGHYQVCGICARKKALGDSNMLPPSQVWLKEGSPGSGRYA